MHDKFRPEIVLNRNSGTALNEQIAEQMRTQIVRNRLPAQTPVASERTLAEQLGVNRNTIHQAYAQLIAEGLLATGGAPNSAIRIAPDVAAIYRTPFPSINLVLPYRFQENLRLFGSGGLEIIAGVMDRAADLEFSVNVLNLPAQNSPREKILRWIDGFVNRSIGIVSIGVRPGPDPVFELLLQNRQLPHVFISGHSDLPHISSIEPDAEPALRQMFDTAYRLGHRNALILRQRFNAHPFHNHAEARGETMIRCAEAAGLTTRTLYFEDEAFAKTEPQLLQQLEETGTTPTLIAAHNDFIAEQVIELLNQRGFSVPEDFSVTGYDRVSQRRPIAGIANPRSDLGCGAVDMIRELYDHARVGDALHRRITATFHMDRTLGQAKTKIKSGKD